MITELLIAGNIIASIGAGTLTEEMLTQYFEENRAILQSNIDQAALQNQKKELRELVHAQFAKYGENKSLIQTTFERYKAAREQMIEKFRNTYGDSLPKIVLVPAIGLFSNGGWAADRDGVHYICVALERVPENFRIDVLLAHEIAHGISVVRWGKILGGFYNEGHASYVSGVFCPGYPEETYLMTTRESLEKQLDWIDRNRGRILEDAGKEYAVMNEQHKFYFTTSFNREYPNLGYLIGYEYLKYLNRKYSLGELRTLGNNPVENEKNFRDFLSQWNRP